MSYYATLAQAKQTIQSSISVDDALLLRYIETASKRLDNLLSARRSRPYFEPYIETRTYVLDNSRINSTYNTFAMHENLLSISGVQLDGTTITSSVVQYPPLVTPFDQLRITNRSTNWHCTTTSYPPFFVNVTGVWGYHSEYDSAWQETAGLAADISATSTTFNVGAGGGCVAIAGYAIAYQ